MLKRTSKQLSMFSSLEDMLSHQHPLFQLSNKINWESFENAFSPLYCSTNGRPAHPIRLMCGLLILKYCCPVKLKWHIIPFGIAFI